MKRAVLTDSLDPQRLLPAVELPKYWLSYAGSPDASLFGMEYCQQGILGVPQAVFSVCVVDQRRLRLCNDMMVALYGIHNNLGHAKPFQSIDDILIISSNTTSHRVKAGRNVLLAITCR